MKVFLDTNVWLSATVFAGLCAEILTESAQRNGLLGRKFPYLPPSQALFDGIWSEAACVSDVDEPADDNDVRLVRAAQADMQILSPRDAWMRLFVQGGVN